MICALSVTWLFMLFVGSGKNTSGGIKRRLKARRLMVVQRSLAWSRPRKPRAALAIITAEHKQGNLDSLVSSTFVANAFLAYGVIFATTRFTLTETNSKSRRVHLSETPIGTSGSTALGVKFKTTSREQ